MKASPFSTFRRLVIINHTVEALMTIVGLLQVLCEHSRRLWLEVGTAMTIVGLLPSPFATASVYRKA